MVSSYTPTPRVIRFVASIFFRAGMLTVAALISAGTVLGALTVFTVVVEVVTFGLCASTDPGYIKNEAKPPWQVKFNLSKSLTLDNGTDLSGSHFQTAHAITVDGCIRLM